MVGVDGEAPDAGTAAGIDGPRRQRPVEQRDERFRHMVGERTQTGAEARAEDERLMHAPALPRDGRRDKPPAEKSGDTARGNRAEVLLRCRETAFQGVESGDDHRVELPGECLRRVPFAAQQIIRCRRWKTEVDPVKSRRSEHAADEDGVVLDTP